MVSLLPVGKEKALGIGEVGERAVVDAGKQLLPFDVDGIGLVKAHGPFLKVFVDVRPECSVEVSTANGG